MDNRYLNVAATFGLIILTVYILYVGKALLLPLIIAMVFWYIIIRLTGLYQRIPLGKQHLPYGFALIIAIISAAIVLYLFFLLLEHSIANIITQAPLYQKKLEQVLDFVNKLIGSKFDLQKLFTGIDFSKLFTRLASVASGVASNFVLILIYLLFLLLEHRTFGGKVKAMCDTPQKYERVDNILSKIDIDINNYLKIKTALNFLAGILSYFLLLAFGIQYAEFWGMLIFLLHYIPFIGPIAAIVVVLLAISIQITTLPLYIICAVILVLIQFAVGNFLEPKLMGTRLNLSPIVILLSLAFWGAIWGIMGMFLCVPIMVIVNIILAKFPATRPMAVLLSAQGRVER